jgi:tripartite-type tricarboxylate transporter receptor subunit TctC
MRTDGKRTGVPTIAIIAAALAASLFAAPVAAQPYPSRPVTIVVPFPAGGGSDLLARMLADHMKGTLGQTIVVENIGGASGSIAVARVVRAAADGYTISFGNWASHVGASAAYPVKYDVLQDLEPVARLGDNPLWIVARTSLPATNLKEMLAWMKANPGKASAATVGVGSGSHLCGISLQTMTGTRFQFVPYRGGGPAMQDLVGGQVDFMCDNASNSVPLARAGKIRPMAVTSTKRWFAAPDVPTFQEAGGPALQMSFWHGMWVPKGTPRDVVARLNAAVVAALADPDVRKRITEHGHEIPSREQQTPTALAAYHKAETDKWWPIIRTANIKLK